MKKYESPEIQIMAFDVVDVITTSNGNEEDIPENMTPPN